MRLALALIVLALAACRPDVKIDPPPTVVHVPIDRFVKLDPGLTRDCHDEKPKAQTYAEAKRLANIRRESIAECNKRWAQVRALQDKAGDK
jgi:hypothetical protein